MRNLLFFFCAALVLLTACRDDEQITMDSGAKLEFSADTVIFDTVFTTIGSATRQFKVYNRNSEAVEISSIVLDQGEQSNFRINVDGDPGVAFTDIFIPADDSIFMFIEVTVDPNGGNTPLIVDEDLVFTTNGNVQTIDLVAWGQDAYFFYPTNLVSGLPPFTALDGDAFNNRPPVDTTWTPEKPIVIYGYVIVDEFDHLRIEPGTTIYFHEGSGLWVYQGGQITASGTCDEPIIMRHDRLESDYDNIPGQWDLMRINESPAGIDNTLEHVIIKNSIIGLEVKPLVLNADDIGAVEISENKLVMNNCIVQQTSAIGMLIRRYRLEATNCLFANSGLNTFGVSGGGDYTLEHCSFLNYWSFGTRNDPSFFMSDLYLDESGEVNRSDIQFFSARNCLYYGNTFEEFSVEFSDLQNLDNIAFNYGAVRIDEMDISNTAVYQNLADNPSNMNFVDPSENDFHLEGSSFPIGQADPSSIFTFEDLECTPRDGMPDLGCYEFVE